MDARLAIIEARERALAETAGGPFRRPHAPRFCSGCPHNTSTRVPEGSRAVAGIGCHYMVNWMPDRRTSTFTQMGGEGVTWVGQQPFTTEEHIFSNLGDGTYFHSGLLAIRQSIAAGVNITYKVLYNDAVAATGGQTVGERPEGHSVLQIMNSLKAEGVAKLVIVTDEPQKYDGGPWPRRHGAPPRRAGRIQREFREIKGLLPPSSTTRPAPPKSAAAASAASWPRPTRPWSSTSWCARAAATCSVQSNCLSVEPVETELAASAASTRAPATRTTRA